MTSYFFYAFLAAGALNFVCSVAILRTLAAAGTRVSFFEIRWQVHKHLKSYRLVTLQQSGRVAWPYYGYQVTLIATFGFALLTLLSLGQQSGRH